MGIIELNTSYLLRFQGMVCYVHWIRQALLYCASTKSIARPKLHGWQNCPGGIRWYQNERAYFIFYVITIKWVIGVREEIKFLV